LEQSNNWGGMTKIFIGHSNANNGKTLAIRDWLNSEGRGPDTMFLDIDPKSGIHLNLPIYQEYPACNSEWAECLLFFEGQTTHPCPARD